MSLIIFILTVIKTPKSALFFCVKQPAHPTYRLTNLCIHNKWQELCVISVTKLNINSYRAE